MCEYIKIYINLFGKLCIIFRFIIFGIISLPWLRRPIICSAPPFIFVEVVPWPVSLQFPRLNNIRIYLVFGIGEGGFYFGSVFSGVSPKGQGKLERHNRRGIAFAAVSMPRLCPLTGMLTVLISPGFHFFPWLDFEEWKKFSQKIPLLTLACPCHANTEGGP